MNKQILITIVALLLVAVKRYGLIAAWLAVYVMLSPARAATPDSDVVRALPSRSTGASDHANFGMRFVGIGDESTAGQRFDGAQSAL